jgi:hypothetical protein
MQHGTKMKHKRTDRVVTAFLTNDFPTPEDFPGVEALAAETLGFDVHKGQLRKLLG